jgi:hypothetical protein
MVVWLILSPGGARVNTASWCNVTKLSADPGWIEDDFNVFWEEDSDDRQRGPERGPLKVRSVDVDRYVASCHTGPLALIMTFLSALTTSQFRV